LKYQKINNRTPIQVGITW